jgi:hypothetical protein
VRVVYYQNRSLLLMSKNLTVLFIENYETFTKVNLACEQEMWYIRNSAWFDVIMRHASFDGQVRWDASGLSLV